MEFDEYYPYVNDYVRENYYKNIFEQAARMAQATVASMGGDYDGKIIAPIHSDVCLKMYLKLEKPKSLYA